MSDKLSVENGKLWSTHGHPEYFGNEEINLLSRVPRLDTQQIRATFANVFLPEQAHSDSERFLFLDFWDQALILCLTGTHFFDEEGNAIAPELTEAGLPYDQDSWILERLAVVVGQMRPDENPERYWQPILELGAKAEHWVEDFINHWFIDTKKMIPANDFVREWKRMLEFCLNSDSWAINKAPSAYHIPSLWMRLMGLPQFATSLWQDDESSIIGEVGKDFVRIAPYVLASAREGTHFISWLCENSAKEIRLLMLTSVAEAGLAGNKYWWKEPHIAKRIARYLSLVWKEHFQTIERDTGKKEMFLQLLHKAASTQEPLALELQSRIASP